MEKPTQDEELKAIAGEILARLQQLETCPDWIANGDKPCAMFKMEVDERVASKGIAKVNFNINKVFAFLEKEDTLKKINPMLLEIKVLHEIKDVFRVNYMQYKGIWPVSNRDFVSVSATFKVSESKIYIGTKACNFPHPEVKGVVRGKVFIGGYIIEKIDENTTSITYISDADLSGSIPGMVKNTLSSKQGEIASKIGPAMEKEGL